ncbi:MAG: class II fructose-bisphosphate aldolase [Planctomycetes bacterium]|nr:class II fructose-bisphosphate aldolase [Planctomycetota bacterium]
MPYADVSALRKALTGVLEIDGSVTVRNPLRLRSESIEPLVRTAVFSPDAGTREATRWVISEAARSLGAWSASVHDLYMARGRGECGGFTVPAINIRALAYDTARAVFRAALRHEAGAVIFEIARSEIGYTDQRPGEYAACVLAAAIKEGWRGPVFLQGDHYQFNAKKMASDPGKEIAAIQDLVRESIEARFLQIDIDASTLVDLSKKTLEEQQRPNFEPSAEITAHVRRLQPKGVVIGVGGEIGEVGKKNSTPEELRAYVDGYRASLEKRRASPGITKVSVQSGTSHGGVRLADGSVAKVKIDLDTLATLSKVSREEYGLAGAVQHGASTLPEEAFDNFPRVEAAEIHLATKFQDMTYDHPRFPKELLARVNEWCVKNCADERKEGETEAQYLVKTRKKALGPFKHEMWDLPSSVRDAIAKDLEDRFSLLLQKLNVVGTRPLVEKHVRRVDVPLARPASLGGSGSGAAPGAHASDDVGEGGE